MQINGIVARNIHRVFVSWQIPLRNLLSIKEKQEIFIGSMVPNEKGLQI